MFSPIRLSAERDMASLAVKIDRVQDRIAGAINPLSSLLQVVPWTIVATFIANVKNAGGGVAVAAYRKNVLNECQSKGAVVALGAIAVSTVVYVLPVGYRPKETRQFSVKWNSGGTEKTGVLDVTNSGQVLTAQALALNDVIALEFAFLAEQ